MNLFLDLETIPTQRPDLKERVLAKIKCPGNITKPESIAKWEAENKPDVIEKEYRATALNGAYGEVTHIGYAFDDEEPQCLYRGLDQSEKRILQEFNQIVFDKAHAFIGRPQPIRWIGHYITGFDLRFLWQRYVLNGIRPRINIPYNAKPWADNVFDTKIEWAGLTGKGGSLDEVCQVMGYEGKGDIDGSKVWDYIKAGRYEEVTEYCKDDVADARRIYKKMTFS